MIKKNYMRELMLKSKKSLNQLITLPIINWAANSIFWLIEFFKILQLFIFFITLFPYCLLKLFFLVRSFSKLQSLSSLKMSSANMSNDFSTLLFRQKEHHRNAFRYLSQALDKDEEDLVNGMTYVFHFI